MINDKMRRTYQKAVNGYEDALRYLNFLPQYKCVAKPIYIACGGKNNPLFSVPVAFAVTDGVCHQLLPRCALILFSRGKIRPKDLRLVFKSYSIGSGLLWTLLSIPIAVNKHQRNKRSR